MNKPLPGIVQKIEHIAAGAGAGALRLVHGLVYGSRPSKGFTAANKAPRKASIIGTGPRSVWQGPPSSYTGAPILRRY